MIENGNIVTIVGTELRAQVLEVSAAGSARMRLLESGQVCEMPLSMLSECRGEMDVGCGRRQNGQFAPGHKAYGPNPSYTKEKASARKLQSELLEGFAPLLRELPNMVRKIDKPELKVASIAKIMPYMMPSLSKVEYNETAPRNISLEVRLAEFKKQHSGSEGGEEGDKEPTRTSGEDSASVEGERKEAE